LLFEIRIKASQRHCEEHLRRSNPACLFQLSWIASLALATTLIDQTVPAYHPPRVWRTGARKRPRPGLFALAAFPIPSKTLYGAARFGVGEAR